MSRSEPARSGPFRFSRAPLPQHIARRNALRRIAERSAGNELGRCRLRDITSLWRRQGEVDLTVVGMPYHYSCYCSYHSSYYSVHQSYYYSVHNSYYWSTYSSYAYYR